MTCYVQANFSSVRNSLYELYLSTDLFVLQISAPRHTHTQSCQLCLKDEMNMSLV